MSTPPLLSFNRVSYRYPGAEKPVMSDFSLQIEAGTVTAILGPNGAGKTTLLHLMLGWLKPEQGQISLEGKPLPSFGRRHLGQEMGLVPQDEHTSFEFTLLDYVLLGRAPYLQPLAMPTPEDYDIAAQALQDAGIGHLMHRSILGISGGEHQLVLVARALTQQPRLLLLDEPTSHLDISNKGRLVELLGNLSQKGVTIIFTTHEPDIASNIATHLVLMQQGKVLQTGTVDEVMTTDKLSALYHFPLEVLKIDHRRVVLWK